MQSFLKTTFNIDLFLLRETINLSGEYLEAHDGDRYITIYIPPNFFNDDDIETKIATLDSTEVERDGLQIDANYIGFNVFPVNHKLILERNEGKIGTVTICDSTIIRKNGIKEYLTIYHKSIADSSNWAPMGGNIDFDRHTITSHFKSFGKFVVKIDLERNETDTVITDFNCQPRVFSTLDYEMNYTDVIFKLGKEAPVTIKIYNVSGRLIRKLMTQHTLFPGEHAIRWDGRNEREERCVSGLYIVCTLIEGKKEIKTVAIVNK